jgi:ubiquinone/menaquinone biosynthesis C-methylase UbiE
MAPGPEVRRDTARVRDMRSTWDALASNSDVYAGDPSRGESELEALFGRLGADPRGGTCVEVGCGPGRMTKHLARRFDRVLALDVSPAMLAQARKNAPEENVELEEISGERLDGVPDESADVLVCYLVLQHLPRRRLVLRYFHEFARVLKPSGEAFVQLPILDDGVAPRIWRTLRATVIPLTASRRPTRSAAFRGYRLKDDELERGLEDAQLRVVSRDSGPDSPYRFSHDVFLRLEHA